MLVAHVVLGQLRLQDVLKPLSDQYAGDINERDFVLGGHDAHVLGGHDAHRSPQRLLSLLASAHS